MNFITVKNQYFISLIKQLLNRLIETTIFTNLNIRSAYNALRIRINNKGNFSFRCRYKHFEYRMMFFKLTNALTNFKSFIYLLLRKYLNIFCIVYFDNILIYLNNKEIHKKYIELIFEKLRKSRLFVNL